MSTRMRSGLSWLKVTVDSLGGNRALVTDQYGRPHSVRLDIRRGGGPFPREGEKWVIDRSLGFWSFAALIVADPPVVTGSNDGIPALQNLLQALEDMGLIVDNTSTTPAVKAPVGHSH
jgi:hypothetical protein